MEGVDAPPKSMGGFLVLEGDHVLKGAGEGLVGSDDEFKVVQVLENLRVHPCWSGDSGSPGCGKRRWPLG